MRSYKAVTTFLFAIYLFPNTAIAEYTLGIGVSQQNLSIESSFSENEIDDEALNIFVDIYHGSIRFNGTMAISTYDNFALAILTASADYLIPLGESFRLFAGATYGSAAQAYDTNSSTSNINSSVTSSPVLGYQLGAIVNLTDTLSLELGYNVRYMSLKTESNFPATTTTEVTEASHTYFNLGILF